MSQFHGLEEKDSNKHYLGDSVYVHFDGYAMVLTTENGYPDDPRNTIVLEPQVCDQLKNYIDWLNTRGEAL